MAQKKAVQASLQNLLKQQGLTTDNQIMKLGGLNSIDFVNRFGGLQQKKQNFFPNWMGSQRKRLNNFDKFYQFYGNMNALSKQAKIKLAQQNPAFLGYNEQKNIWTGVLGRQANSMANRQNAQKRALVQKRTNQMINKTLTQAQITANIPAIIKQIVASNQVFSKYGIGPVTGKKFPLYAGRWVDKITGSLRVLPKASAKYLNPASYVQRKQYLQAKIINKWNQFVMVVQQYAKFAAKDADKWQTQKLTSAAKRFQKQKQIVGLPTKIINQYKKYAIGYPMTQPAQLFWSAVTSDQKKKLQEAIVAVVKVFKPSQAQQQGARTQQKKQAAKKVITIAQQMLNTVQSNVTKLSEKANVQAAILAYGYSFANSKLNSIRNNLITVAKILNIPANISDADFQKIQKQMQQDKQAITKVLKQKKGFDNKTFPKLQIGRGSMLADVLTKSKPIDRIGYSGIIQDIKKKVKKDDGMFAGFNWKGLTSDNYQGPNLVQKFDSSIGDSVGTVQDYMATPQFLQSQAFKIINGKGKTETTAKDIKNRVSKLNPKPNRKALQLGLNKAKQYLEKNKVDTKEQRLDKLMEQVVNATLAQSQLA